MIFEDLLTELSSPEFPSLRPMQTSVLEQYESLLDTHGNARAGDIAIEMPAGTGKTLVALLVSEFYRRKRKRISILAGTKQLANQIAEIASYLGIPTCVFEGPGASWSRRDLRKYQRGENIAIMNYWAYFNLNPTLAPAEILILDDAHLAENAISDLFSIRITTSNTGDLYTAIVNLVNSLRPGRHTLLQDILFNVPARRTLLVPFTDYLEVCDQLVQLLDEAAANRLDEVRYLWPNLRSKTDALALFVTPHEIQFRPIVYPTQDFRHFNDPLQRVYLSATLGDPSDLQRRLGCKPLHLISPSNPQPGERGRRMITLMPQNVDTDDVTNTAFEGLRKLWPVARKRLWMCRSWHEAEELEERVPPLKNGSRDHIWELRGGDDSPLDDFRQARIGHLFTACRYDGIDLLGDQCRLAIIPSPPVVSDPQEEFFSEHLRDATFLKSRFSQRVAQALGRCNRDAADFAVYLLLDPRFERRFGGNDPEYLAYLPPDIQPEMEAALENCENAFLHSCEKASDFLTGSFSEWDAQVNYLRERLPSRIDTTRANSSASAEVSGWLAMWKGDPTKAADYFRSSEADYVEQHIAGPLAFSRYSLAWARFLCYLRQHDNTGSADAIEFLEKSAAAGPSSWFTNTLRACANDLCERLVKTRCEALSPDLYKDETIHEWEKILYDRGLSEHALNKFLTKIEQDIGSGEHDRVVGGLLNLGPMCGFDAFRPRRISGMPDAIWRFSGLDKFFFTWEVKGHLESHRGISLDDVNQAHSHGRWANSGYSSQAFTCIPLILSASTEMEPEVSDRLDNVRCMHQNTLISLFRAVRVIFDHFKAIWRPNDSQSRSNARARVYTALPTSKWFYDAYCSAENGFIIESQVVSPWTNASRGTA